MMYYHFRSGGDKRYTMLEPGTVTIIHYDNDTTYYDLIITENWFLTFRKFEAGGSVEMYITLDDITRYNKLLKSIKSTHDDQCTIVSINSVEATYVSNDE
jgi:hypothetical protein